MLWWLFYLTVTIFKFVSFLFICMIFQSEWWGGIISKPISTLISGSICFTVILCLFFWVFGVIAIEQIRKKSNTKFWWVNRLERQRLRVWVMFVSIVMCFFYYIKIMAKINKMFAYISKLENMWMTSWL